MFFSFWHHRHFFPFGQKGIVVLGLGWIFFIGFWSFVQADFIRSVIFFLFGLVGGLMAMGVIAHYGYTKQITAMERPIPLILARAALLQDDSGYERLIASACEKQYAPLNQVFQAVQFRSHHGFTVSTALKEESRRQPSPLVRQLLVMLAYGMDAGTRMTDRFLSVTQYLRERFSQQEEIASTIWIQRVTLLLSAAVLIPFMSGSLAQVSSGLTSGEENLLWEATDPAIVESIINGSAVLRFELLVIASVLAALLEGSLSKSAIYFVGLWPVSEIIFWWVST